MESKDLGAEKQRLPSDAPASPRHPVSASPRRPVSPSPRLPVPPSPQSPRHRVSAPPRRRVSSSVLKILVHLSRFGLAALFLVTAGAKLLIVKAFAANVAELLSSSGFNSERWMWPTTIAVITAEVLTAVFLLVSRTMRIGAICAAALLIGFAGYALYYVYALNGEPLECGCFGGIIGSQLGVKTALRNLALLIPAILVFIGYKRTPRIDHEAAISNQTTA